MCYFKFCSRANTLGRVKSSKKMICLRCSIESWKGNKYLIVFDDVWDLGVWNDLKFAFSNDKNGSRILFTSRFSNVASEIEIGREPHNLHSLTDGESWELLQRKVFGKEDCPQAMHELGMEIAKSCKGLPLTLVTIAGVLATVDYDGWQEVAIMFTSSMVYDTDLCKNSLQLSYEHLPHYLKPCLLYFGAFPEDREIETNKLMWLWIAEGFVPNTEPKRLEDVAEDYMMDLVSRNLVMVSKQKSMGGVKTCYIHDLLHEFCKFKAEEENFLQMLQGYDELSVFNVPPNLPRLSICSKQEHFKKSRIYAPNLSSLLFFNQVEEYGWSKMADISFVYCIYKHLRVLDLEPIWLNCKDFPNEINVLVQLRYLAIRGCIEVIPPSVANLSHLETFLVTTHYAVGTVSLPETIWIMKNLRHLHIMGYSPCCFPNCNLENSSKLHNLDTLSILFVSSGKCLEEIVKKIPNIRQLEIKLSEAKESSGYSLESLNQLESLESLIVSSNSFHLQHDIEYCFPSVLKELTLDYLFLPWSKISLIEELPNLEVLKLLGDSFKGTRWDMKGGGFPKLRVLWLERLDIVEWTDTDCDGDCFPCLEKLLLVGATLKLETIPSCLMSIPTLEMIKLETAKDNESLVSLVRRIEEEQRSYGNENLKILIDYYNYN
ncbi:hypothetical protein ACH5RR_028430 [Cinchona calisaya]|uniref:NB-ARC domain-containing protein n=1 Tax=Cinchona calisaya TaxID=153742 RepID=A0ABD2YQP4_9GENT